MSAGQVLLYALLALAVIVGLRRYRLRAGVPQHTPVQVAELLSAPGAPLLLDVRTEAEHSQGAIKGSLHIPLRDLVRHPEGLDKHRHREIVVYCQTGSRSLVAAAKLRKLGFNASNMKGGLAEWNFSRMR